MCKELFPTLKSKPKAKILEWAVVEYRDTPHIVNDVVTQVCTHQEQSDE